MTLAVLQCQTSNPTARDLMERALEPHVLIGMPHLNAFGLSETWLMKELGHRHWLMLARDMGMDDADFRTADDKPAYAAICASALRHARLAGVAANDVLTISSTIAPVSRTQVGSKHNLLIGTRQIAEVELISTFVYRATEGDNHSITRIAVVNKPTRYTESVLAKTASDVRAAIRGNSLPLARQSPTEQLKFQVSRSQEFNGAGLFYFAEFQALMDRSSEMRSLFYVPPSNREVFFCGNVQQNEFVIVTAFEDPDLPELLCYRLTREDGKIIAWARCTRAIVAEACCSTTAPLAKTLPISSFKAAQNPSVSRQNGPVRRTSSS